MIKKIVYVVFCVSCLQLLSGCWDYQEIKNVANVAGIAVDKGEEKKFKVTCEIIVFKPSANYEIEVALVESEGDSIFEALRNAISITGKRLYIGHCKAIIFSEEIAKDGIMSNLDFFTRDHELRMTLLIFIAKGNEAAKILQDTALLHEIASYELERLVRDDKKFASVSEQKQLFEVMQELLTDGVELTLPSVEIKEIGDKKTFKMEGIFCFKDDKLLMSLELEHLKSFLILDDKMKGGIFSVEIPEEKGKSIAYEVIRIKPKFKYEVEGDTITLKVNVNVKTSLGTVQPKDKDKINNARLVKILEDYLKKELEKTFQFIKEEVKSDICGFERRFYQKNYQDYQKFTEKNTDFLSILELTVSVKAEVEHYGTVEP